MDEKKKTKKEQCECDCACNESSSEKKTEASEMEQALKQENESLIKEIEDLKKQSDDYKDKWMRNVAEFDNYKKRNAKLWQDAFTEGVSEAVLKIVAIGDNLDRAASMITEPKTQEGLINLKRQFNDALKNLGVEEIDPTGEEFNPNVAEAVMQVEDEEQKSDTVKQTFEKGYKLKEKIIKYAKVSVVK